MLAISIICLALTIALIPVFVFSIHNISPKVVEERRLAGYEKAFVHQDEVLQDFISQIHADLDRGIISAIPQTDLKLSQAEVVLAFAAAIFVSEGSHFETSGYSVPIADGGMSIGFAETAKVDHHEYDSGDFYLSNHRFMFIGKRNVFDLSLNEILSIQVSRHRLVIVDIAHRCQRAFLTSPSPFQAIFDALRNATDPRITSRGVIVDPKLAAQHFGLTLESILETSIPMNAKCVL